MPVGGVMVLGHNFDSVAGFNYSLHHAGENLRGPTWRGILGVIDRAGVRRDQCFFTNVYMGLIDGPSAVGKFPGARDTGFVHRCQSFLAKQISVQQPRVILTLGKEVLPLVVPLSPELRTAWSTARTLADVDQMQVAIVYPSHIQNVPTPVAVAALTHPAFRHLNVGRRHYAGRFGDAAEIALIQDAMKKAIDTVAVVASVIASAPA